LHGQLVKIGVQKGEHPLGECTLFTMRHDGNQDVKAKLGSRTCCGSSGCRDYQDVRRKDIGSKQDVKAQLGSRSCELGDPEVMGGQRWVYTVDDEALFGLHANEPLASPGAVARHRSTRDTKLLVA
jgi:hypothetical protein